MVSTTELLATLAWLEKLAQRRWLNDAGYARMAQIRAELDNR